MYLQLVLVKRDLYKEWVILSASPFEASSKIYPGHSMHIFIYGRLTVHRIFIRIAGAFIMPVFVKLWLIRVFFLLTLSNSCHWQKYCKLIHGCSEWLFGLNIVGFPTMTRFRNQDAKVVPAPSLTAGRCNDAPVQLLNDYICKSVEGYLPQSQSNGNFLSEQEWTMYYRIWKRYMLFV